MKHILPFAYSVSAALLPTAPHLKLNDGAYWRDVCSGIHDDLDEKSAVARAALQSLS